MRVLIACESSGKVREAFRKLGHEAWSNDILPADDDSEFHIQGDCVDAIQNGVELETYNGVEFCDLSLLDKENANEGIILKDRASWDLIIMHPPCTALCVSGNRWYGKGMPKHQARIDSMAWTVALWELAKFHAERVCMENPVGVIQMPATQYVQPWQFGHGETKKTGFWLHNLPALTSTDIVEGRENRVHKMPPSQDRWKKRSETYQGIADAMASQWGILE